MSLVAVVLAGGAGRWVDAVAELLATAVPSAGPCQKPRAAMIWFGVVAAPAAGSEGDGDKVAAEAVRMSFTFDAASATFTAAVAVALPAAATSAPTLAPT